MNADVSRSLRIARAAVAAASSRVFKNDPVRESTDWNGIPVDFEWLAGQKREYGDVDPDDVKTLKAHYGYVRGTESDDGEDVDVYVKPDSDEKTVFLVIQVHPDLGSYDEMKYMLGFHTIDEAQDAFIGSMPTSMFGAILPVDWDRFVGDILEFHGL